MYVHEILAGLVSPVIVLSEARLRRQLLRFADTELYTSYDIGRVAQRETSLRLQAVMRRHAADELKHFRLFSSWAASLQLPTEANYTEPVDGAQRGQEEIEAGTRSSSAPNQRFPTRLEYLLYLAISESRACLQFGIYRALNWYDPRCRRTLGLILRDERSHCRYATVEALRTCGAEPGTLVRRGWRVVAYVALEDWRDLAKLMQWCGSWITASAVYFGLVTPYGRMLHAWGMNRRGALRRPSATGAVALGDEFWRRPG